MRFIIFSIIILVSVFIYLGTRLIVHSGIKKSWAILAWALLFIFCFLPIVNITLRILRIDFYAREALSWLTYAGLGFLSLAFVFMIARDIILFIRSIIKKIKTARKSDEYTKIQNDARIIDRKQFLLNSINTSIMGLSGFLTGYGIYEARSNPKIEKVNIQLKNLPSNFNGFRLIQLSDIHAGATIGKSYIQNIVNMVNQLEPDIVVITGDLVDGSVETLRNDVSPLGSLQSKFGVFFVTGNHEYYSGVFSWINELNRLGIKVLQNEHVCITIKNQQIVLAGVTDYNANNFIKSQTSSPERALQGTSNKDVKILLAHQPRSVYKASKAGSDLLLSGHTHGGQYFPYNFFVYLQQPFIKGLNKYKNTLVYVNRGAGYWGPPLRIGAPSEITEIKLIT